MLQTEHSFRNRLKEDLEEYLRSEHNRFPEEERLKVDLHCHEHNSDVPDELIGRLLRVPETWLESDKLLQELANNGCDAFTITNHNNARSCYELQDKGKDILTAAEFSCLVPDFETGIHVLTYGFSPDQEVKLNKLRRNIYAFLDYTCSNDIPVIWAHPLYHYASKKMPPQAFFHKMLLLFERFETLNGQRDTWQNLLVREWIRQASEESIEQYAREFSIPANRYSNTPYKKILTGGSDSHMGIFAGTTGSYLHVPNLKAELQKHSRSELALEAIRKGNIAPYGTHQNTEKLTIAFLNYACQIALNYKDPGLIRLLLHQGELSEKVPALIASNLFSEVQNHKITMSFIRMFYECMMGKKPAFYKKLLLSSDYKPIFDKAADIADKSKMDKSNFTQEYYQSILSINDCINRILSQRIDRKIEALEKQRTATNRKETWESFISKLELPIYVRSYTESNGSEGSVNISSFLDGLSFPFFSSLFILAAHFTGAKAMFNTRPFLKHFSKEIGKYHPSGRILWLTDTFGDSNGVSMFLQQMHKQIQMRNLPIDILVCSDEVEPAPNLIVVKPMKKFVHPAYPEQPICIPDFVGIHNLFMQGEYDRIICSTEGVMGLCGLYLKHAYTVNASFFLHTDWLMFARKVLKISGRNLDRVKRILRFFYKSFDRVLVLNTDQQKWLTGKHMGLDEDKVKLTAHWANELFTLRERNKQKVFEVEEDVPVVLYAGRVSLEKGVDELPEIYRHIRDRLPKARLVIVGKGPALQQVRQEVPGGIFMEWVEQEKLAQIYSSADLLLLPSRFDTFCNVVLEALSCGLPVVAYNTKGPKDIVQDGCCGFLVENRQEMAEKAIAYLLGKQQASFRKAALQRARQYDAETIIANLLNAVGLNHE